jgi:DNA-binding LacI/PurR family transcriptional regulator
VQDARAKPGLAFARRSVALRAAVKSASAPTVRSLARSLGLSHTTVSDALRNKGRVDPETAARIRKAAKEAGYKRNPLAAAVMSELRRSRGGTFRGVLAAVDIHEPQRRDPHGVFHHELLHGGRARAAELGFKLEEFVVNPAEMTLPRLDGILQSRGIHGVLVLPSWYAPDWSALDWSHYAGVYTDYIIERPALHCVCCNHYRSTIGLLAQLAERGYRRPGFFVEKGRDERTQHRFSAGFRSFQETRPGIEHVPMLITPTKDREEFMAWFRRHQPDVVLSHFTEVIDWMEACGASVPKTHGFVSLNLLYKTRPCAGLDQQPRELGARAVELLIAQLQRNELGVPAWPTTTTIPAKWVEGPTVRKAE